MPNWTTEDLLNHVQELIGEPVGGYYNISTRLRQLNQAQREMVQDTRALTADVSIPTVVNQRTYYLPDDFLTYAKEQPYYVDTNNNSHKLQVVDVDWMDSIDPGWRDDRQANYGKAQFMVMTGAQEFVLYPAVNEVGTITIPYVVDPDELEDFSDEVFNGVTNMNRYSVGLAYKVAAMYLMPRVPQLAQQYLSMYNVELRKMRHDIRSNPQHQQTLRPKGYTRRSFNYRSDR